MAETLALDPVTELDELLAAQQMVNQVGLMERGPRVGVVEVHYLGSSAVGAQAEMGAEAYQRPAEAGAAEAAAEIWRMTSPFNAENVPLYGSEEVRLAAVETVRGIGRQAQLTNKYLSGAHKRAAAELALGGIDQAAYDAQVGEIAASMALINPQKLREVGEAQRASLARRQKAGLVSEHVEFVDLTSRVTDNGVELAGIDAVVACATGVATQAELVASGLDLKSESYGQDAFVKAEARHAKRQAVLAAAEREQIHETRMRIIRDDEAAAKADSTSSVAA